MKNIKLIATDLDGTFLKNDRSISSKNLEALAILGEKKIVRAVATGRNLHKVRQVLNNHVPFDYIVYSSGAGVYDWKAQKELFNRNITKESVKKLFAYLIAKKFNFHAFFPSPENHKHWYFRGENPCDEFERYFEFNSAFAAELNPSQLPETELCQFLVIIPEIEEKFNTLKTEIESVCGEIRVIRSSSPITEGFIWIEIFHHSVSKGNGVKHLCGLLGIDRSETVGIGNDYNDFDLLEFTRFSFLTENAPPEIRGKYPGAPSNENDAFAYTSQLICR